MPHAVLQGRLNGTSYQQWRGQGSQQEGRAHLFLLVFFLQQLQPFAFHLLLPDALLCEGVAVIMAREQAEIAFLFRVKVIPRQILSQKRGKSTST